MMKVADAGFLLMDRPESSSHVSMLTAWSIPEGAPESYLADLVVRWRECRNFAQPFNLRVKGMLPDWEVLAPEDIDIDYHLRHSALPKPGGERELGVLASRLHSSPLDKRRPLWELHVIEGLEDNRFAIFLKLHHSQIDGMGAMRLLERVLSTSPDTRNMPAFWEVEPKKSSAETSQEPLKKKLPGFRDFYALGKAVTQLYSKSDPDNAVPFDAPKTGFNVRLHQPRRLATQLFDINRLKAVAKKADVTVNDVALSISAGGLRNYLLERGELPEKSLTAGLPVSLRVDENVGNAISFILAKLHTEIADPVERLQAIHRSTTVAKKRFQELPSKFARETLGTLTMGPYMGQMALGLAGRFSPVHNAIISNVPGPKDFLFMEGARMEAFYPMSAVMDGQALNITFITYAGRCAAGFTACRDAVPSMQKIAVGTGEALAELEQALGL